MFRPRWKKPAFRTEAGPAAGAGAAGAGETIQGGAEGAAY